MTDELPGEVEGDGLVNQLPSLLDISSERLGALECFLQIHEYPYSKLEDDGVEEEFKAWYDGFMVNDERESFTTKQDEAVYGAFYNAGLTLRRRMESEREGVHQPNLIHLYCETFDYGIITKKDVTFYRKVPNGRNLALEELTETLRFRGFADFFNGNDPPTEFKTEEDERLYYVGYNKCKEIRES